MVIAVAYRMKYLENTLSNVVFTSDDDGRTLLFLIFTVFNFRQGLEIFLGNSDGC